MSPSGRFTNREAARFSGERVGFSFGENWTKLLGGVDEPRLAHAERSLTESFAGEDLSGRVFVDLGAGSGLFSLAAARLGAARVVSVDVDPFSLACAAELRHRFAPRVRWDVHRGSALDRDFLATLPRADVLYSWGVLHHTGAMWSAVGNALGLLAPGGLACIALYNRPNKLRLHMALKRTYNRMPRPLRPLLAGAYAGAQLGRVALRGGNPLEHVRKYPERERGMSFWRDVEDWLGGLPYEFAEVDDVRDFVRARDLAVVRVRRQGPGGNDEFLIRRPS